MSQGEGSGLFLPRFVLKKNPDILNKLLCALIYGNGDKPANNVWSGEPQRNNIG